MAAPLAAIRDKLVRVVRVALEASETPEEVRECAIAAAGLGDPDLMREVAERIGVELDELLEGSGAWEAELLYNKLEAWQHTGHRAGVLADAWGYVGRPLLAEVSPA